MSEFINKVITPKGMELLTKAMAGERLTFTSIKLGNGVFEGDIGLTDTMVSIKQNLPITKVSRTGSQATLSAGLKLEDIIEPFNWSEIGVYAKGEDDIEHLYMYSYTSNTSYISKDSLNEKLINVTVMVSNAVNITATIENSLIYLTAESLESHTKDITTHQDIRDKLLELSGQFNSLDISWENIKNKPSEFTPSQHNHTKQEIGLSNVPNYTATSSVTDSSTSKFATASAVKEAYDKGVEALNYANSNGTRMKFVANGYVSSAAYSRNGSGCITIVTSMYINNSSTSGASTDFDITIDGTKRTIRMPQRGTLQIYYQSKILLHTVGTPHLTYVDQMYI